MDWGVTGPRETKVTLHPCYPRGTVSAENGVLISEAFDQVVVGLLIGDRGYERLLSRNQPPAMTIPRNVRVITDGQPRSNSEARQSGTRQGKGPTR